MKLRSAVLEAGTFPPKYSKDGANLSPPIEWSDVPSAAKEFVLVLDNITPETREPFVHWLVYRIPTEWNGLPEGFKHRRDPKEPADVAHGRNSMGWHGYDGPIGTAGRPVRLRFKLFALDQALDAEPGLDKDAILGAIAGHVLDEAELVVRYEREAA